MSHSDDVPAKRVGWMQKFVWWWQATALRLLWLLVGWLPPEQVTAAGWRLMAWFGPRTNKHRHVLANLKMLCPERSDAEIEGLGRAVWGNIGAVFTEFALLDLLTDPARNHDRVELINNTGEPDFFERPRPRVFVSAHLANWELIGYAGNRVSGKMDVIYNPQPNPWLEKLVQRRRRFLGCGYVDKTNGARKLLGLLKAGRAVGLMIDVRVESGQLVPFCGVDASTTTLPAWLSLRTGCDILPIQIERLPGTRFRITFHPALRAIAAADEGRDQAILRVSRDINEQVGSWIAARPQDWLCTKRRWPKELMRARGVYSDRAESAP